jgi:hypothetical protein
MNNFRISFHTSALACLCLFLSACATEVARQPEKFSALTPVDHVEKRLVINDVHVKLNTGYSRLIPKGMECELAGRVPQGKVYRPTNMAFSIEGAHIHEAYLVVNKGKLAGFYLPVERAFSANDTNDTKLWEER